MANRDAIAEVQSFLGCATPSSWIKQALANLPTLLIDHAHCEKKAASTALHLMYRYKEDTEFLMHLSRLAREELRHFEQVLALMQQRNIQYGHLSAARYAESLRARCRTQDPGRLVDVLIVGAFIEARSCERFHALLPHLDDELAAFYRSLLRSEARHFKTYLNYAEKAAQGDIGPRVQEFRELETHLITSDDTEFRFHSGAPVAHA